MAQQFIFLNTEGGEINRIINLHHLSHAAIDLENGDTVINVSNFELKIQMPFPEFVKIIQKWIKENYDFDHKYSLEREKSRLEATQQIMINAMREGTHS